MVTYNKPYKNIDDQLALLISRGMDVSDEASAKNYLRRIGYYRLSAYWYPFRKSKLSNGTQIVEDNFRDNVDFDTVIKLYAFDRKLRLHTLDAIERIEISVRTEIALIIGLHDHHAHLKKQVLHGDFTKKIQPDGRTIYQTWIKRFEDKVERSREDFMDHFRRKYPKCSLPIWMAIELWDFGMLSVFLNGLSHNDKTQLAINYNVSDPQVVASWVRSLNFVRNVCAHHGRLWNRALVDQPKMPLPGSLPEIDHLSGNNRRLYAALTIMQFFMKQINGDSTWSERLKEILLEFPANSYVSLAQAGFPNGWETQKIWL